MSGSPAPTPLSGRTTLVVGADHRSTDAGFRERLFLDEAARSSVLSRLSDCGIEQAAILSTCDRVEIYAVAEGRAQAVTEIEKVLAEQSGLSLNKVSDQVSRRYDDDAHRRLFRTACALESAVIGESQVLGQVKEAYVEAQNQNMVGKELEALFQAAFSIAKQVRHETKIGEGAVTVASAAIRAARDVHGDLADCRLLLIGLGDVGNVLLEQFRLSGLRHTVLTGRARRVERAATAMGCHFLPYEEIPQGLVSADIVIAALSAGRYAVTAKECRAALSARRGTPIIFFDCGAPEDLDPEIAEIDQAFLFTLSDIERMARDGRFSRQDEADQAERMVDEAVLAYRRDRDGLKGTPAVMALREHFDAVRRHVLEQHRKADVEEATRLLVTHLLHHPMAELRQLAGSDPARFDAVMGTAGRLFGLDLSDSNTQDEQVKGSSDSPSTSLSTSEVEKEL